MKKLTLFLLVLSFMFLQWGISNAAIVAIRISPDNTRAVFNHLNNKQLLAAMIYGESLKDSSFEGRHMVATTAILKDDGRGLRKTLLQPEWFSCFNPYDKGFQHLKIVALNFRFYSKMLPALRESNFIAESLLSGLLPKHKTITEHDVKHFAAVDCENKWIRKMTIVAVRDGHKFLSEKTELKTDHRAQERITIGCSKIKTIGYVYWMEEPVTPLETMSNLIPTKGAREVTTPAGGAARLTGRAGVLKEVI